jgi:hypothetical protein
VSIQLDMKEIERQVYMFYHEDGLIDIAIGFVFLGWGLMLAIAPTGLIGLLGLGAVAIWYLGKRYLTIPRVGVIEPGRSIRNRLDGLAVFLLLLGLAAFVGILVAVLGEDDFLANHSLGLLGLVIALGIGVGGYVLRANRLYAYAVLLFVAFAGGEALNSTVTSFDAFILSVILAGSVILFSGLVVLARFLRKYPLPAIER